jgi:putative redox protein
MGDTGTETKTALVRYAGADQFIGCSPSGHAMVIGVAQESGAATPMELLLIALGGCTGADVISILKKKRQPVAKYEVEVKAERRAEYPRIYTRIEVTHRISGQGIDPKAVAQAVELSQTKYCSVSAMLGAAAKVSMRYEIVSEG